MIRSELKKRCIEACEDEFNDIVKKYSYKFTEDEPFIEVEQEEMDEVKTAYNDVKSIWVSIKQDMMKGLDKKVLYKECDNMQYLLIRMMCEIAQCYAVIERQKPNLT